MIERDKPAMNDDIPLPFELPAVARKKVSAAFDAGRITSDGGDAIDPGGAPAGHRRPTRPCDPRRAPCDRVIHLLPDILRTRICAIACAYEDADDQDRLVGWRL